MTLEENKQWLHEALYSYTEGKFRDRFKGIVLTESAMMKMGTVFGFLATHDELIQNFFDQLERLNKHEEIKTEDKIFSMSHRTPNKITELNDDGTLFGFSFLFHYYCPQPEGKRTQQFGVWKDRYVFGMNGGLLFRGFGNQNFSVTLDNNIGWQIHT